MRQFFGAIGMGVCSIFFMASLILWVLGQGDFTTAIFWLFALTGSSFVYHLDPGVYTGSD